MLSNCRSNSCSNVSGNVSNCSYRLTVNPVTSSHFGLAIFHTRKTSKTSGKSGHRHVCLFEWPGYRPWMPAEQAKRGVNSVMLGRMCARPCMCACARACVSACLRDVFAIYDNNISPRLIMIIIKMSILYFIQIRQSDDFTSTDTRLVHTYIYMHVFIKGVDPDTKVGGRHTCQPREKFWRAKRGAIERSEPTSEGESGGPPPKNFKNLHGKWCNLRYSWAIFVNIISLYCNKTCINYASFITIKSIG